MRNTQLILYPQGSNSFTFTTTQNQYCGNSSFTSALNSSATTSSANFLAGAILGRHDFARLCLSTQH